MRSWSEGYFRMKRRVHKMVLEVVSEPVWKVLITVERTNGIKLLPYRYVTNFMFIRRNSVQYKGCLIQYATAHRSTGFNINSMRQYEVRDGYWSNCCKYSGCSSWLKCV
jgi:hypothetical protein